MSGIKAENMSPEEVLSWVEENRSKWEVVQWDDVMVNGETRVHQRVKLGEDEFLIRADRAGYPISLEKNPAYEGVKTCPSEEFHHSARF